LAGPYVKENNLLFYLLIAVPILLIAGLLYANRKQAKVTIPAEGEPDVDLTYRPPLAPNEPKHENPVSKIRDPALIRLSPEDLVMEVLKECYDPEIPLNIVDLGLIYDIDLGNEELKVKMSLTTPGCPSSETISLDIQSKLQEAGFPDPKIQVVWDPPWTAERISEEGRKVLGL
jgi:metal-sulfur cluster biosynthetic enzyme